MSGNGHRFLTENGRYNHAATIAFTVENNDPDGNLTKDEILHGLLRRLALLLENEPEFRECCEVYDTYATHNSCPECHQAFANHNADGSCVQDQPSTIQEVAGRYTCTACGYEWSAVLGDDEIPEVCECQKGDPADRDDQLGGYWIR